MDAIECKWNPADLDPTAMTVFRHYYPNGANLVVAPLAGASFSRRFGTIETTVLSPAELR